MGVDIPEEFTANTIAREGSAGQRWIDALPALITALCDDWDLRIDGQPLHGYLAVVFPVRRADEQLTLKVAWIYEGNRHEGVALSVWNGNGAVRLLEHDEERGALLLERLDAHTSLESISIDEAVPIAARLLRRLSVPGPPGPPKIAEISERWRADLVERWKTFDSRLPRRIVDAAVDCCAQIGQSAADLLVNEDLHYGNVLRGTREPWLVIDPKPVIGDPEFAVAALLWTRFDQSDGAAELERRFNAIVDLAGLDDSRARAWTLARVVDFRLWSLSMGFTHDAARCESIASWLVG